MIKQLYAIICTISLMAALPAFGMESTYPCDNCQEEKSRLDQINKYQATIKCIHILCQGCHTHIYNSWKKSEGDKIWGDCTYCSYFYEQKNKQCWQTINSPESNSSGWFTAHDSPASAIKRICPDRVLHDITDATSFGSEPIKPFCIIS